MHIKIKVLAACIMSIALSGCFESNEKAKQPIQYTLDGSSQSALKESEEKIINSLPNDKKDLFKSSFNIVSNKYAGLEKTIEFQLNNDQDNVDKIQKEFLLYIDGKTSDQIITEAFMISQNRLKEVEKEKKLAAEHESKKSAEPLSENIKEAKENINELKPQLDKFLLDKNVIEHKISPLAKVEIKNIRIIETPENEFNLAYTVINNSDLAFDRYNLILTLDSPERINEYKVTKTINKMLNPGEIIEETQTLSRSEIESFPYRETIVPDLILTHIENSSTKKSISSDTREKGLSFISDEEIRTLKLKLEYAQKKLNDYEKNELEDKQPNN